MDYIQTTNTKLQIKWFNYKNKKYNDSIMFFSFCSLVMEGEVDLE